MKEKKDHSQQSKRNDFIIQEINDCMADLKFLIKKERLLSDEEASELRTILPNLYGETVKNKKGNMTFLPPIGVTLINWITSVNSPVVSLNTPEYNEHYEMCKSIFRKFFPKEYDLFF
jgi:hypothetical protein